MSDEILRYAFANTTLTESLMKSNFTLKNMQRALLAAGLLVTSASALAATVTTTFQVTANVAAQCKVSASDLAFGTVDPLGGNVDQTTTVIVKCTKNSPYTVGLSAGTTTGATINQRLMANGTDTMQYNLYTDSGRANIWGNSAVAPLWVAGTGAGLGNPQSLTVSGRV